MTNIRIQFNIQLDISKYRNPGRRQNYDSPLSIQ